MDQPESGKDKIRAICNLIRNETLEPAQAEAQRIIAEAENRARALLHDAEMKAARLIQQAQEKMEKERALFNSSLVAATRQALEALRQDISTKLFNSEFTQWIEQQSRDPKIAALLISTLVQAIEKEGTNVDFSAYIPKTLSPASVNAELGTSLAQKMREKGVVVGDFLGGVKLKLHDKQLTLDLSESALRELFARYMRKDFRSLLFTT